MNDISHRPAFAFNRTTICFHFANNKNLIMASVRLVSYNLRCLSNQRPLSCMNRLFCTQNADVFAASNSETTTRGKKCKPSDLNTNQYILEQMYHFIINFGFCFIPSAGNDIRLIGRVRNQVATLPTGFDSFLMRTATKNLGKLIG